MLVAAHATLGRTLMYVGAVTSAHTPFLQGMVLYDPQQHRAAAFLHGEDAGVNCQGFAARMLWHLGYPDQGLAQSQEAYDLLAAVYTWFTEGFDTADLQDANTLLEA